MRWDHKIIQTSDGMKKIEEPRIIILYNNKNKKGKEKLADGGGWGRVGNL